MTADHPNADGGFEAAAPAPTPQKQRLKPRLAPDPLATADEGSSATANLLSATEVPSTGLAPAAVGEIAVPEEPDPASAAPPDLAPVPVPAPAPVPFKLKPRLAPPVASIQEPTAPSFPEQPAAAPPANPVEPLASVEGFPSTTETEPSRAPVEIETAKEPSPFKLKPKASEAPPVEAAGVSIGNWPTSDIALPTTETPATGPSGSRPPLPNAIPIATLPIWQETDNPEENPVFRMGVAIALVFVPLGICIAGFLTWKHFNREEPEIPRRPTIAIPREPASIPDAPAPSTLVLNENTAPLPAEIRPPLPTENNTITLSPPKTAGEASLARPNPPSTFSTTLAPGVTANVEGEVSSVAASPAFRAFVASVKISGVFQGASGRAFLNGRMTRVGETVDSRHGIILENIDVDKKHLVFKDASGAIVTRKY